MATVSSKLDNNILTVCVAGRVDSTNADNLSADIDAQVNGASYTDMVLDFENLEYISSAGLRVILRLRRENPSLKVVNVNTEVYDVLDMTGFTEMISVQKAYRSYSIDGCKVIGKGAKGTIYRYNPEIVVKVYNNNDSLPDIQRERDLARCAFVHGIPTAISYDIAKVGDKFASVFELLDATAYSELLAKDDENFDKYVSDYANLLKLIHDTSVKPDDMPDIKENCMRWVDVCKQYLEKADGDKLEMLFNAVPDTLNILHGDFHTNNVMLQNGETMLIDMDTLAHGHPIFDLAIIYFGYVGYNEVHPNNSLEFLGIEDSVAAKVWEKFLPIYLGTNDKERIADVQQKISLVCFARMLRHAVRRGSEQDKNKAIEICVPALHDMLQIIDSLDF